MLAELMVSIVAALAGLPTNRPGLGRRPGFASGANACTASTGRSLTSSFVILNMTQSLFESSFGGPCGYAPLRSVVCFRQVDWYATRGVGASEAIQISANRDECVCQCIDHRIRKFFEMAA